MSYTDPRANKPSASQAEGRRFDPGLALHEYLPLETTIKSFATGKSAGSVKPA